MAMVARTNFVDRADDSASAAERIFVGQVDTSRAPIGGSTSGERARAGRRAARHCLTFVAGIAGVVAMTAMVWIRCQIDAAPIAESHSGSAIAGAPLAILIVQARWRLAVAAMKRIVGEVDARSAAQRQRPRAAAAGASTRRRRAHRRAVGRARGARGRCVAALSTVPEEVDVAVGAASQPSGRGREHARRGEQPAKLTSRHGSRSMKHHAPPRWYREVDPSRHAAATIATPARTAGWIGSPSWTTWS